LLCVALVEFVGFTRAGFRGTFYVNKRVRCIQPRSALSTPSMSVSLSEFKETLVAREVVPFWALLQRRTTDCTRVLAACICTRLRGVGNLVNSPPAQGIRQATALIAGLSRSARSTFDRLTGYIESIIQLIRSLLGKLSRGERNLQVLLANFLRTLMRVYLRATVLMKDMEIRLTSFLSGATTAPILAEIASKMPAVPSWVANAKRRAEGLLPSMRRVFDTFCLETTRFRRNMSILIALRGMCCPLPAAGLFSLAIYRIYGSHEWSGEYWTPILITQLLGSLGGYQQTFPMVAWNVLVEEVMMAVYPTPWLTTFEQIGGAILGPEGLTSTILGHHLLGWIRKRSAILAFITHLTYNSWVIFSSNVGRPLMLMPAEIQLKYKHGEELVKSVSDQLGVKIIDGRMAFTTGSNVKQGKGHVALACQNSTCYALAAHNAFVAQKRLFDVGSGPRAVPMLHASAKVHFNTPKVIRGDANRQRGVANAIREHDSKYPLQAGKWTQCKCCLYECKHIEPDDFVSCIHSAYYLSPEELALVAAHENLVFCHPLWDAFGKYEGGYHVTDGTTVKMYTLSNGEYECWEHKYPAFLHGTIEVGDTHVAFVGDTHLPSFMDTVCGQVEFCDSADPMAPFETRLVGSRQYYGRRSFATADLAYVMPEECLLSLQSFVVGKNPSQLGINSFLAHLRASTTLAQPQVLQAYSDMHAYVVSTEAAKSEQESIDTHLNTAVANYSIGASRDNSFSVLHYLKLRISMAIKRLLMWLIRFKFFAWLARFYPRGQTLSAITVAESYGSYLARKNQVIPLEPGVYRVDDVVPIPTSELTPKPVATRINLPKGNLVLPSGQRFSHLAGIQVNKFPIFPSSSSHNQYEAMVRQVLEVPIMTDEGRAMLRRGYDLLFECFPEKEAIVSKWDPEYYFKQYVSERPAHIRIDMEKQVLAQPSPGPAVYNTFVKYEATKNENARVRNISADSESSKVVMGPLMRWFAELFKHVWSPDSDILYFSGRTSEDLSVFLRSAGMFDVDKDYNYKDVVVIEIDQEKYDAHVSKAAKEEEITFLEKLCVKYLGAAPVELNHVKAILTQKFQSSCGIKFSDPNSRASGSAATTTGNTSLALAMMLAIFSQRKKMKAAAIGDDSLIVINKTALTTLGEEVGGDPVAYIKQQYKNMGFTVDLCLRENLCATTFCSGRFYPVLGPIKYLLGPMIGRQLQKMGIFGCPKAKLPGVLYGASIANRIAFSHVPFLNDINECLYAECIERKVDPITPEEYKYRISPTHRHHQTLDSERFVRMVYSFTHDEYQEILNVLSQLPTQPGKGPGAHKKLSPILISCDLLLRIINQDLNL